jgi:hypothetical protein
MRKVTARSVLLSIGVSALVLVAASPPSLPRVHPQGRIKSAHFYYARDWKRRHRAFRASRRLIRPYGYARVYGRGSFPRPSTSYETDLLFDCLLSQPFVICP